jgi:hypothetical protein
MVQTKIFFVPLFYSLCSWKLEPLESISVNLFLSFTNFIEKSINNYDIKWVYYENIFYDKTNGINLVL